MTKLEDRKKALEGDFTKLEENRKVLVEQGKEINRKLSEIQAEQLRLQGSYREIENLLREEDKDGKDIAQDKGAN